MSSRLDFDASAARLVAQHGGLEYTVTVVDARASVSLAPGSLTVNPRSFAAPCTLPTPYSPGMVDGDRIQAGDANVWIAGEAAEITFDVEPEMLAKLTGPHLGTNGLQFVVGPLGLTRHAGGLELHLRSGVPA